MLKHTPGPWKIEEYSHVVRVVADKMPLWETVWPKHPKEGKSVFVCRMQPTDDEAVCDVLSPVNLANAHLIAAAPDMYNLLCEIAISMTSSVRPAEIIKKIEDVLSIAKNGCNSQTCKTGAG